MANTNDSLSPLAARLFSRAAATRRIGAGRRLFERLGIEDPYAGGSVADRAGRSRVERYSFLSSADYFAELRGLARYRQHLLARISRIQATLRLHERFERRLATESVRALRLESPEILEPTLIDWSTQVEPPEARRRSVRAEQGPRRSPAERALRNGIASASRLLEQLERVASLAGRRVARQVEENMAALAALPEPRQAEAVQRIARTLRGVSKVASRGTALDRTAGRARRADGRALTVAQHRADPVEPRGLRRQLERSPVVMELERPRSEPPPPRPIVRRAAAVPPVVAEPARRELPIARVADEARRQVGVSRAGPEMARPSVRARPNPPRPTERIARIARRAASTPLYDTTRGVAVARAEVVPGVANRVARRLETGTLHQGRRVVTAPAVRSASARLDASAPLEPVVLAAGEPTARRSPPVGSRSERAGLSRSIAAPQRDLRAGVSHSAAGRPSAGARSTGPAGATRKPMARAVARALPPAPSRSTVLPNVPVPRVEERREGVPLVGAPSESGAAHRGFMAIPSDVARPAPVVERLAARQEPRELDRRGVSSAESLEPDALRFASPPDRSERPEQQRGPIRTASSEEARRRPASASVPASAGREERGVARTSAASSQASAQRRIVVDGSRRDRARPTVRAAARGIAQERIGGRGRLIAPAVSTYVDVNDGVAARASARWVEPFNRGRQLVVRPRDLGDEVVAARTLRVAPASVGPADAVRRSSSRERAMDRGRTERRPAAAPSRREALLVRRSEPVERASRRGDATMERVGPVRLASTSRAVAREIPRDRVGETGTLLVPRVVAPFRQEAPPRRTPRVAVDAVVPRRGAERSVQESARAQSVETRRADERRMRAAQRAASRAEEGVVTSGVVARAALRGLEPPADSRRRATPAPTPERVLAERREAAQVVRRAARVSSSGASQRTVQRRLASRMEPSATHRTPASRVEPSATHRTPASRVEPSATRRTPTGFVEPARVFTTPSLGVIGARRGRPAFTRGEDPARPVSARGIDVPPPVASSAESGAESTLGRALRRLEQRPVVVAASPVLPDRVEAPELRFAGPSRSVEPSRVRPTTHALARTVEQRSPRSVLPRPVRDVRTARVTSGLRGLPGTMDGVLLTPAGEALDARSIAGGVRRRARPQTREERLQQVVRAVGTLRAAQRGERAAPLGIPAVRRAIAARAEASPEGRPTFEARIEIAPDGTFLGARIVDAATGAVLARPAVRAERRMDGGAPARRAELSPARPRRTRREGERFFPAPAPRGRAQVGVDAMLSARQTHPEGVRRPERGAEGADLPFTLDALVRPPRLDGTSAQQRPLLRRRAWARRGVAAELGVLAPALSDADLVPEDRRLRRAPAWARRAGRGTAARAEGAQARPERETNGLLGALARAERPDEIVRVIVDRRTEIRTVRRELPAQAVRIIEQISTLDGSELELLRRRQRVVRPSPSSTTTLQSRSQKGPAGITPLSPGQDGLGATKIMKLANKLMNLIHLAESNRRKEAQDQVRMARESLDSRVEGGAKFPGLSVEDHDMNIEALQKSVLDMVLEKIEELDSRREDPDGHNKWW